MYDHRRDSGRPSCTREMTEMSENTQEHQHQQGSKPIYALFAERPSAVASTDTTEAAALVVFHSSCLGKSGLSEPFRLCDPVITGQYQ